jgi:hypothetical protein
LRDFLDLDNPGNIKLGQCPIASFVHWGMMAGSLFVRLAEGRFSASPMLRVRWGPPYARCGAELSFLEPVRAVPAMRAAQTVASVWVFRAGTHSDRMPSLQPRSNSRVPTVRDDQSCSPPSAPDGRISSSSKYLD